MLGKRITPNFFASTFFRRSVWTQPFWRERIVISNDDCLNNNENRLGKSGKVIYFAAFFAGAYSVRNSVNFSRL